MKGKPVRIALPIGVLALLVSVSVVLANTQVQDETGSTDDPSTPVATVVDDGHFQLSDDAVLKSEQEASELSLELAREALYAENPRIATIELLSLEHALRNNAIRNQQDPDGELIGGWDAESASVAVWEITLEGDAFYLPRCPLPLGATEQEQDVMNDDPRSCGSGKSATVVFQAEDGVQILLEIQTGR